jgi:hypothetical protein
MPAREAINGPLKGLGHDNCRKGPGHEKREPLPTPRIAQLEDGLIRFYQKMV